MNSLTTADVAAVPPEVVSRIKGARSVLTVCHVNPDPDAVGFVVALLLAVEALGGRATAVSSDPVPPIYDFIPHAHRVRQDPEPGVEYDLIVVGDCGDVARTGSVSERHADLFARVPIVNIDHHISNTGFGAVDWIDATAAAACEMATLLMPALGIPLTASDGDIAAALMAGVVGDTANFQHPNTTPRTLRVAAELVSAGAPLSDIARLIYRTKPNGQLRLFGRVLERLKDELDGRLVWVPLYESDYAPTGTGPVDAEGLTDLVSQSATGQLILVFRESGETTKLSVRTREGGYDATVLAALYGGGGHARAAGATVDKPIDEAIPLVLDAARAMIAVGD